jgi:hypothetical protein
MFQPAVSQGNRPNEMREPMNNTYKNSKLLVCASLATITMAASSAMGNDPTGACCAPDADTGVLYCTEIIHEYCVDLGGYWYGAYTTCTDPQVECAQASDLGACCWEDADGMHCLELEDYKCEDLGGQWWGVGTLCTDPQIDCAGSIDDGACCVPQADGSLACLILTAAQCEHESGYYYGDGSDCSDPFVECDPLQADRGACCYEDPSLGILICSMLYENACLDLGGFWYGPNVSCADPQVECGNPPAELCSIADAQDCAGRPNYQDEDFMNFGDGRVAVQTASPSILGGSVVTVFDLSDSATAPLNNWWQVNRYANSDWSQNNLGSVFGLTVDADGAIYVTSTRSWNSDIAGFGGWGAIYRLDETTGAAAVFATLPNTGSGLGNISYDCEHDQFFVSNMEDGLIYRLDAAGNMLDTSDHGTPWNGSAGPAALGDRVWAVEVHGGRLYYSVWNEDRVNKSATTANEIWSIQLDAAGMPNGAAQHEVSSLEYLNDDQTLYSSPISDIRFSPEGTMLLAERTMSGFDHIGAHDSRVMEYECIDNAWQLSANTFTLGLWTNGTNASGGVDVTADHVWASGDALHLAYNDNIYGFQGMPTTGGTAADSILVDYQDNLMYQDKTQIGDLVITNEGEHCFVPWAMDAECILNPNGSGHIEMTFGFSHDGNQDVDSISIQSLDGYTMTPDTFAGPFTPQHSFAFVTDISGSSANESACFEVTFTVAHEETCTALFCVELPSCFEPCPGDVNADMVVDISDLLIVLSQWGELCNGCSADIDGSGLVDVSDLLGVIANWGTACG